MLLHEKIKLIRTRENLTQTEFANILGISQGKVSELEKGTNKPSFDTLKSMYDNLSISIDMLISENPKKDILNSSYDNLTDSEKYILSLFSKLPEKEQHKIEGILEYKVKDLSKNNEVREINYYYKLASAGTGQLLFDTPPTKTIEIPAISKYSKVNYAIGVNGDSMEPLYSDGDIVLVEVTPKININEIGIFAVDGECYIKKYGGNKLISINKNYPDIMLNEDSICFGKVVDTL